jgi:hypothetical protein
MDLSNVASMMASSPSETARRYYYNQMMDLFSYFLFLFTLYRKLLILYEVVEVQSKEKEKKYYRQHRHIAEYNCNYYLTQK